MAQRTCHNCVYSICDQCEWLRLMWLGEPILPRCANHPWYPGQLHDVPGVPCRNYRPKFTVPEGDNIRLIALGDGCYTYIDAADYEWASQFNWRLANCYAARFENGKTLLMHRELMRPRKGKLVDHIDGNKANNCRWNLRVCTRAQNMINKRKHSGSYSIYKCVFYDTRTADSHCHPGLAYDHSRDTLRGDYHGPARDDNDSDADSLWNPFRTVRGHPRG